MKQLFNFNSKIYRLIFEEVNAELNELLSKHYYINSKDSKMAQMCKKSINRLLELQENFPQDSKWHEEANELIKIWQERLKELETANISTESIDNPIKITVYNDLHTFSTKHEAINFFKKGLACCDKDSSEYDRYLFIIDKLKSGETIIDADNINYSLSDKELNYLNSLGINI